MGQYKVPQNVEAEDKILGPLTFKQFAYALIGVGWAGILYFPLHYFIVVYIVVVFPPTLLFLLLAFYQRDGQNFEQLLIAMAGYFSQARRRVWVKEAAIVTFKVEPKAVMVEQSQRNPAEVRSELDRLAQTIDSRGWYRRSETETIVMPSAVTNDRLVNPAPAAAPEPEEPTNDMLDIAGSPLAQNLAQLMEEASNDIRNEAIQQMNAAPKTRPQSASVSMTSPAPSDILKLATENDDLTVTQLAANANRVAPIAEGQTVSLRNNGNPTQ